MVDFAKLLSSRVPRYTSYPTAVQFHAGVNGNTQREWINALPQGTRLSLYFHFPFCKQLCWFCGCHTHVANSYRPIEAYLELLRAELKMVASTVPAAHTVDHIHWGGGSPTILAPTDILNFARDIRDAFNVSPSAEFAVEIDPRTITAEMASAFGRSGVNRVSLGVQDCDVKVLSAVNRRQTNETTRFAVDTLRAHGIEQLNINLMYGLPYQTVDGVRRTIDEVHQLSPNRLAVFGYAHLPAFKPQQKLIDEEALPNAEQRLAQYEAGRKHLQDLGYVSIGLDHFARPDDPLNLALRARSLARNFQGYTTDAAPALIGMGSSAISALPLGYTQNAIPMPDYRKAIMSGTFATAKGVQISGEDRLRRAVISDLMCYGDCDLAAIAKAFGQSPAFFTNEISQLRELERDGIVILNGSTITVPPQAHVAVRVVCAVFDRYLVPSQSRHATAI